MVLLLSRSKSTRDQEGRRGSEEAVPGPSVFPSAQLVKNLPAMQDTLVRFLGGEDPLEKGMHTHSSMLAWRMPWTEEAGGLQSISRISS